MLKKTNFSSVNLIADAETAALQDILLKKI